MGSSKIFLRIIVHHEEILRLHELLLHARRREKDVIAMTDRGTSTCASDLESRYLLEIRTIQIHLWTICEQASRACLSDAIYPAMSVELATQLADQVRRVIRVMRRDQSIWACCIRVCHLVGCDSNDERFFGVQSRPNISLWGCDEGMRNHVTVLFTGKCKREMMSTTLLNLSTRVTRHTQRVLIRI